MTSYFLNITAFEQSQGIITMSTYPQKTEKTQRHKERNGANRKEKSSVGLANKRGMVLPFTPLMVSFDSLNYFVDMHQVRIYTS